MRKFLSIFKFIILLAIVIGLPAYVYFEHYDFLEQFYTTEGVNLFLEKYKTASILVYIALQILQIVISIIPGQFIQFAGGYAYSFWLAYLLSIIGIACGSTIAFYLSRILGRDAMYLIFGEERISKFIEQLNSKRAFAVLFVLFLIPGLPKDLVTYAAGLSHIKLKPFLMLSLTARTPALMGTIAAGSMLYERSYVGLGILAAIAIALFIILFLK